MKKLVAAAIGFVIGAAAGGAGVYVWQKKKYESQLKDELAQAQKDSSDYIDQLIEMNTELSNSLAKALNDKKGNDIKEYYEKNVQDDEPINVDSDSEDMNANEDTYSEGMDEDAFEEMYRNKKPHNKDAKIVNLFEKYGGTESMNNDKPYLISAYAFGEIDHYKLVTLTYTEDGILMEDKNLRIVEDVDNTVGIDNLSHIDEGDEGGDCLHVRNDKRMCDYEIYADARTYDEIVKDERELQRVVNSYQG